MKQITSQLFRPVDITFLIVLRVAFGLIMMWEVERYFEKDWIREHYIEPVFHFTYEGFHWVKPWPGDGMILHFYVLAFLGLLLVIGLFYRVAAVFMFLAFTYVFLLEVAYYLNHFYLVVLISFLLIFLPAHKAWSVDALLWKKCKTDMIPAWPLWLLRFQIGLVYVYGALAKMNYDWLILAQPMHSWLGEKTDFPIIGRYFHAHWVAYFMSWSGMLIDLFAPFLLSVRITRPFMYAVILAFHFMNDRLFFIGIFPWFMVLYSTVFFPADWPKRLVHELRYGTKARHLLLIAGGVLLALVHLYFHRSFEIVPFLVAFAAGMILAWTVVEAFLYRPAPAEVAHTPAPVVHPLLKPVIVLLLAVWVVFQSAFPLRHYFIPGDASWTEEGHRFAWRMMLRMKYGRIKFFAYDPETESSFELNQYLTPRQADKMSTRPHMIHQYAKFLKEDLKKRDIEAMGMRKEHIHRYQIRVEAFSNLNCRVFMRLIDPQADLSKVTYSDFRHNWWVLLQDEALRQYKPEKHCGLKQEESE
ncbi:MAG: gamma-glutamyl carboxylase [Chitinophagales bacterium]|nr:MAG: gamma-glutamyl carboxylase [Chitinophagales bacterium]